ncbi:MAG: bifunctional hydroxymethylpyrimidine kinase/phosphomethylpyrimidine kinase [Candidatus Magnetominusculus sp. LBB02]|nr:bifunctional hydroxymethylpyrimidine kinase/phosphomethylpyrimidine kinase [Candidatus Magnetominusculus sp. LBB02]
MVTALTVAGLDPCGGAGIAADLKVFNALGVHGMAVATSLTAQNTCGVEGVYAVSGDIFQRQLTVLLDDIIPNALKTGILCNAEIVDILAAIIRKYKLTNLVVDPVAVSSSGKEVLTMDAVDVIKKDLLPLTKVFTPNIAEAALFSGIAVNTEADIREAAAVLHGLGCEAVLITGGHLTQSAADTYYDGSEFIIIDGTLYEGSYHGTGCVLSAAIAANIALGHSALEAIQRAKRTVDAAIIYAYQIGKGMGLLYV